MSDKTEDKTPKAESGQTGGKSKGPVIAVIAVVALVAIGGMFAMTRNGVAESDNGKAMSEIAPASADAPAGDKAEGKDAPMIKLGNPVVAKVNGEEIKRSDVFNFISGLPEQVRQMPIQTLFPLALEQVINNKIVTAKADGAKLSNDPEVTQLVDKAKDQIIRNVFIERQVDSGITQKKLLAAYKDMLDKMGEVQETKARHILVDSEDKAKAIIKQLDGGADFEKLAKEDSKGPSASKGGELGWFAKNEMVPEFADAAFALKPGEYSKTPVKTQFGWHVIKVEERRKRPEPEFEQVKPQLEAQLRQDILKGLVAGWQKDAKIQKYDINGEPVKDDKKKN